ncbi:hypothetical protein H6P81_014697 [Aristolochia fimbriata]|uniref:Cytochrome P450 n=1 Tax=Aristolochia fimbriata TaxID=158543 RepID=A0AAV7E6B9_ARIFI|nr:hypothetical protein H6P81_014697 [Aristolochia fimbriata]
MDWVLLLWSGFLSFLLLWFWRRSSQKERRDQIPKGSLGWPLIGETLHFIASTHSSNPVSFMQKRAALYGRVFKSHILGRRVIISTDAGVNKAILQNNGSFVPYYPKSLASLLGENSILRIHGSMHKRVHSLLGRFFKSPAVKDQVSREFKDTLHLSMKEWKEGQVVLIQDEAQKITFQVLIRVLLGLGPGEEVDRLFKEFKIFAEGHVSVPVNLPGTKMYYAMKARESIKLFVDEIIKERMKKLPNTTGEMKDVIDMLLNEIESKKDGELTADFICGNIIEMMMPGESTMPTLFTLAVKHLSDSPLALKELLEENMELKKRKIHEGEEYEWADYMSLEFTQYVISESLRLGNLILATWRKTLKDVNIDGYLFPEGSCVLTCIGSVHLNEENYEHPYDFNPWRWKKNEVKMYSNNFIPFGSGGRLCPGYDLARLAASVFLHHLVTNQRWVAEEDYIDNFPNVHLKRRMPIRISPIS